MTDRETGVGADAAHPDSSTMNQKFSSLRNSDIAKDTENGTKYGSNTSLSDYAPNSAAPPDPAVTQAATATTTATAPVPQDEKPESPKRSKAMTAIIMLALCMAVFLAALDTTIITTALPSISQHFKSSAGYTWVGSAYLLGAASSTPIWGKVSDIFGRKPILLMANIIFFVGSLVCALSYSIRMLITARAIQGIGGGGLITLVSISIGDLFSMRVRGLYYGIVGFVWAVASAIGPLLGGVFAEKVTWRWCFYINIPFQGLAFCIILFFLNNLHTPKTPIWAGLKAIDWLGSVTIVGGTVMFLLGLEFGGVTFPWDSATVICLLVFGVASMVLFVVNEWRLAPYPIIPLHVFRYRSNIATLLVCFCHGFTFIGATFYLPLYFQAVLGKGPILSGVYTLSIALALSILSMCSGLFIRKTGQYLPAIWFGMFFMTLGFGLLTNLDAHSSIVKIILYQIVAGVGTGPNFQAPLIALQSLVPPRDIGAAVSTFQFTRNIATSMSVVIGGVVFQNAVQRDHAKLAAALGPELADQLGGFSAGASVGVIKALPPSEREVAREVYAHALHQMWIMYTVFAAVGFLCSFLITKQLLKREHEMTKTGLQMEEEKKLEREERRRSRRDSKRLSTASPPATPVVPPSTKEEV